MRLEITDVRLRRQTGKETIPRSVSGCLSCIVYLVSYLFSPLAAFAQTPSPPDFTVFEPTTPISFISVAAQFRDIANKVIPFLIGLAIMLMVYGIFRYVAAAGDSEKIAEGRKTIIYGIVAIFLMLSFWGLVLVINKSIFG